MPKVIKILEICDISVKQCRTLEVRYENSVLELLLVCYAKNKFAGYLNSCPHTGVNLNWQPDQCFDYTEQYLACSVHGALFQPDDGKCIYGPCNGQSLTPVKLIIEENAVYIDLNDVSNDE